MGRWWERSAGLDDTARMLYVDIRTSLAEDLLLVSDKMSMAWGLEARVPFLDLEYLAEERQSLGPSESACGDTGNTSSTPSLNKCSH